MIQLSEESDGPFGPTTAVFIGILFIHPLLAGLFVLGVGVSDVAAGFGILSRLELWSLALVPIVGTSLLALAYKTRRADIVLSLHSLTFLVLAVDISLLGAFMAAEGSNASSESICWLLYATLASHGLLIVSIEWKVSSRLWRRWLANGRIDLGRAVFDPRVPGNVPTTGRWILGQALLAAGPAIGVLIANILRAGPNAKVGLIIAGLIVLPGSLIFTYVGWAYAVSGLFRVVYWEIRNHRTLTLPCLGEHDLSGPPRQ